MWAVHALVSLLFIALGLVFMQGRGAFLIAGYNTSSRAEKEKYDERALCRFMGKIMFLWAACFLIMIPGELWGAMVFHWVGWGLCVAVIIFMLIYSNTGNRFKKQ